MVCWFISPASKGGVAMTRLSLVCILLCALPVFGQKQEQYTINTAPQKLVACGDKAVIEASAEPFASGKLNDNDIQALIEYEPIYAGSNTNIACVNDPNAAPPSKSYFKNIDDKGNPVALPTYDASKDKLVTIVHILRWADAGHQNVKFQEWYVYDPHRPHPGLYWHADSANELGTYIDGKYDFRLVVVHFDFSLNTAAPKYNAESFDPLKGWLYPVQYTIAITKAQTQLQQDIAGLLQIMGYSKGGKVDALAEMGYYWVYDFHSNIKTSQITIDATLTDQNKVNKKAASSPPAEANPNAANTTAATPTAANNIASQSYHNEKPTPFGLGVAVPITSYRDLTYSSGQIAPQTVNRQNVYITANFYLPPTEIGGTTLRWLPHPFFGLPLKGQPLRNSLYGIASGWRWFEPFFGVVLDVQKIKGTTPGSVNNHYVWKGVYGINISISALSKALSSATSATSTTTSKK